MHPTSPRILLYRRNSRPTPGLVPGTWLELVRGLEKREWSDRETKVGLPWVLQRLMPASRVLSLVLLASPKSWKVVLGSRYIVLMGFHEGNEGSVHVQ